MRYVALGDSITAGELASSPHLAYPSRIVQNMQGATGLVLAEPGWTSEALLSSLTQQPRSVLQQATAVSIWVGGDNVVNAGTALAAGAPIQTLRAVLSDYSASLSVLLDWVTACRPGRLVVCTQYNPFPNSPVAVQGVSGLNAAITAVAVAHGAAIAPIHAWFEGHQSKWIAGYKTGRLVDIQTAGVVPVHPNNLGHRAIADGLTPLLYG